MFDEIEIEDGFKIIQLTNSSNDILSYKKAVENSFIQLHFSLNENAKLNFGPHYSLDVISGKSILLYNPNQNLPIDLNLNPKGRYLIFVVAIKRFHSFFSRIADLIPFLNDENRDKKYYLDKELSPSEILVLNQILEDQKLNGMQKLFVKAKAYETLSLYFDRNRENQQSCPFLNNEANVDKIKKAKQLIINNMAEPPSLQEISNEIGLSISNLKDGFKHIYGKSVFNFLFDYKMEYARKQLLSNTYNVSEISDMVGYSTASHFITAFKKKYGTTPKQYILSLS
ncbi:MAG: helix-turn-helix transcriptional regulator [Flavobacteriaceae bacterium]|nr:helix-turn-helix transcriptional regulator [Flavobacteriaceae bacterium]